MAKSSGLWSTVLGFVLTLVASQADIQSMSAQTSITPPDVNSPVMSFYGRGVQIYRCSAQPDGSLKYKFQRPEADLFVSSSDKKSAVRGYHYFLPHPDGGTGQATFALLASPGDNGTSVPTSTVTFSVLVNCSSNDPSKSIPSLLLRATSHSGFGPFSMISYAQRLNTAGGVPQSGGACSVEGAYIRVPYTARYRFWSQVNIPPRSTPASILSQIRNKTPFVSFFGQGFQIYTFNGSAWALTNATAVLSTIPGNPAVGKHYFLAKRDAAGGQPSWEIFAPRSRVTGKPILKEQKDASDVPWLLLQATSIAGSFLATVKYIQRLSTSGGIAPTSTSGVKLGDVYKSPYSAIYAFYGE